MNAAHHSHRTLSRLSRAFTTAGAGVVGLALLLCGCEEEPEEKSPVSSFVRRIVSPGWGGGDAVAVAQAHATDTPGVARAVRVRGDLAFVAAGSAGLRIFDVRRPPEAVFVGGLDTPGDAWGLDVAGETVYVADDTNGLVVVDVAEPAVPRVVATVPTTDAARSVRVSGRYAYVACSSAGLLVLDVEDRARPMRVGRRPTPWARAVEVEGDTVLVADSCGGLWVVDAADREWPVTWGRYFEGNGEENWGARDLAPCGDRVLLAAPSHGLRVIDLSDPANPVRLAAYGDEVDAVVAKGRRALLASAEGVELIDLSDPRTPRRVAAYHTAGEPWDVDWAGDWAFVAMGTGGLLIFDIAIRPIFIGHPERRGERLRLEWTGGEATYLEWTPRLDEPTWTRIPGTEGSVGFETKMSGEAGFFRVADPSVVDPAGAAPPDE